jgi:hypothetical protein
MDALIEAVSEALFVLGFFIIYIFLNFLGYKALVRYWKRKLKKGLAEEKTPDLQKSYPSSDNVE